MSIRVVAGIPIFGDEILMGLRLADDPEAPSLWEFPGGKVEEGEESVQALKRELWEELGIQINRAEAFLNFWWIYPPHKKVDLEFFLVPLASKELGIPSDPSHAELRWFLRRELPSVRVLEANQRVIQALCLPQK